MNTYLLTTEKINLDIIFKSEQLLFFRKRKKVKGKSKYIVECKPLNQLSEYLPYCQLIIDRILYFQKLKERSLTNLRNLFVNISQSQFQKFLKIHIQKQITAISILSDLKIIEVNHNYSYSTDKLLGKSFSKSYRIHPDYYSTITSIKVATLLRSSSTADVLPPPQTSENKGFLKPDNLVNWLKLNHNKIGLFCQDVTISKVTDWIYLPINRLPRVKRKQLLHDNDLVEIDIRQAHLQTFISLITDYLNSDNVNTLPLSLSQYEAFKSEFERFKTEVLEGDLYELIGGHMNMNRNDIKPIVMQWLASSKRGRHIKYIRSLYPMLTIFIDHYNEGTRNKLLNTLMTIEGTIINTVINTIRINYPDCICLPVFDSLIVCRSKADQVSMMLAVNGSNVLGFTINAKVLA